MSFQIVPLPSEPFQHLFQLNAEELAKELATRMAVDRKPGFPCRVSLADAEIGEEVILVNYEHHNANSPYRSSHAVFVRTNARPRQLEPNLIPDMLRTRPLSIRGFSKRGMMLACDLVDGEVLECSIEAIFRDPAIEYIHLHFAKAGCFAARVNRA